MTSTQGPPSFGRSMGVFWLYTLLRFGLFGVLFGLLWLLGVRGLLGALIALVLSVPLSYVLLARPRAALANTIEQRVAARRTQHADVDAQLRGDTPSNDEQAPDK
jgi:hypothetical protein